MSGPINPSGNLPSISDPSYYDPTNPESPYYVPPLDPNNPNSVASTQLAVTPPTANSSATQSVTTTDANSRKKGLRRMRAKLALQAEQQQVPGVTSPSTTVQSTNAIGK